MPRFPSFVPTTGGRPWLAPRRRATLVP